MKFLLIILLFSVLNVFSQEYKYVYIDSLSNGSVQVSMDDKLSVLLSDVVSKNCEVKRRRDIAQVRRKDPCKDRSKLLGYKIQVFHTNEREKAEEILIKAKEAFKDLYPEIVYTSPSYRVLIGNYFTSESANSDLNAIRRKFRVSFLIKWRVWCRRAK